MKELFKIATALIFIIGAYEIGRYQERQESALRIEKYRNHDSLTTVKFDRFNDSLYRASNSLKSRQLIVVSPFKNVQKGSSKISHLKAKMATNR